MMADTPSNQEAYPQNPAQKPGIGFPIARFVVVVSLATACVVDCAIGRYKGKATGETALLRQLLSCFSSGDLAVADRFYGNYWMVALLMMRGADVCFRKHQMRHTDFRSGKRLGKNDHLVPRRLGFRRKFRVVAHVPLVAKISRSSQHRPENGYGAAQSLVRTLIISTTPASPTLALALDLSTRSKSLQLDGRFLKVGSVSLVFFAEFRQHREVFEC